MTPAAQNQHALSHRRRRAERRCSRQAIGADERGQPLASAQDSHQHPMAADASAATKAFQEANASMMQHMQMAPSGDPDMDFAMMMTPHHQGAVDMAKIELQYGKDPELRKLAESVIKSQEEEIAFLKKWQMQHMK